MTPNQPNPQPRRLRPPLIHEVFFGIAVVSIIVGATLQFFPKNDLVNLLEILCPIGCVGGGFMALMTSQR